MRLHQSLRIVRPAIGDRIVDGVMLFIDLFQPWREPSKERPWRCMPTAI